MNEKEKALFEQMKAHILESKTTEDARDYCKDSAELADAIVAAAAPKFTPRLLLSIVERRNALDNIHGMALAHYERRMSGESSKNDKHYIYEAVMGLLGEGVWDAMNSGPPEVS